MYEDDLEKSTQECEGAMSENIQCYFMRRSQLKEKLEAIEDNVKEEKSYITTLNGIKSSFNGVVLEGRSPMKECT